MVKCPAPYVGACEIPRGWIQLQKNVNKISINTTGELREQVSITKGKPEQLLHVSYKYIVYRINNCKL